MTHRIPFNYDLYLTGKYRAVYREAEPEIKNIHYGEPVNIDGNNSPRFYLVQDTSGGTWVAIYPDGTAVYEVFGTPFDVLLEPIPQPFHLPAALKGANLITRDGRCVTQFKPNPDQAGPKAYIAMVGDDLIYYNEHGCVNRSCEPHPLDLFIKIN